MPATVPMMGDAQRGTNPAHGVIVASPAMDPVSNPTNFGLCSRDHSTNNHAIVAKEAAISVLRKASEVTLSTATSLPALNPYQPNQSRPLPIATSGMLLGVEFLSVRAPI